MKLASGTQVRRRWRFYDLFAAAPGTSEYATENQRGTEDEIHIVVFDFLGEISGFSVTSNGNRTNAVLETLQICLKTQVQNHHKVIAFTTQIKSLGLQVLYIGWTTIVLVKTGARILMVRTHSS